MGSYGPKFLEFKLKSKSVSYVVFTFIQDTRAYSLGLVILSDLVTGILPNPPSDQVTAAQIRFVNILKKGVTR